MILAVSAANASYGQNNEIYDKGIASLQVVAGDDWMALPVITLGADGPENRINISFDDLTHTYHRYAYKIEHCEADWTVSEELFSSDYVAGFQEGNTIEDYEESVNTILDAVVSACSPRRAEVIGRFRPRGGIAINVKATYGDKIDE